MSDVPYLSTVKKLESLAADEFVNLLEHVALKPIDMDRMQSEIKLRLPADGWRTPELTRWCNLTGLQALDNSPADTNFENVSDGRPIQSGVTSAAKLIAGRKMSYMDPRMHLACG